jgi:chemotaxis protein MotB
MQSDADLDSERFIVTGHADTQPRADNATAEGRARNRRVDISIVRGNELDILRTMSIEGDDANDTGPPEGDTP